MEIIHSKQLSVARFGCGELAVIRGEDWGFQKNNPELVNRLKEILQSDDPKIAICIPDVFKDRSRLNERAKIFWSFHVQSYLYYWNKYTKKHIKYFDALFTRFYMDLKEKDQYPIKSIFLLKRLWQNEDIVIIEGVGSRLGYKNDLFSNAKSLSRILCPAENAYSKYEQILNISEKYGRNKLILIALGMTATVLSFDLCKRGCRAIDIGHVDLEYEWHKMKASKKVPVNFRYINELDKRNPEKVSDEEYLSQIIFEIN